MVDSSEEARRRAEANFKKKERQTQEGEQAWAEHLAAGEAADTNRARLRALRLAKDAADAQPGAKPEKSKRSRKGRSKQST